MELLLETLAGTVKRHEERLRRLERRHLRDNPRVPWALRDLCNPWAWAYSLDPSRLQYLKLSRHS
jgi:hypothetical protein